MDVEQLQGAVQRLVWPDHGDLNCGESGHPAGHSCLLASDGTGIDEILRELSNWYGTPLTQDSALAALPSDIPVSWECVWAYGGRWIGLGRDTSAEVARPLLTVAHRPAPSTAGLPADASWVDRLVASTGWEPRELSEVDWADIESRLGTRLPSDYKRLIDTFGDGLFNSLLDVFTPDNVIWHTEYFARQGQESWEPHPPFPAPGGLVPWAGNEHEQSFYWVADDPDPDRWTVYATYEGPQEGIRFDCTASEFLFRQLTDPENPFSADYFRAHWFQACDPSDERS
ncbi:SMI1/KNR4 family protein [Streptomyces albipurpureus]|uniref:SMI1/KNR4 family protein n=1 Tax=Streptomyces albipurpureus TaxID=2897419 RepID=A0ABT0UW17_9ACTN|nr:SMI1/KNR4 family protein [Streptomyces sp. CWNU-1]MCM2392154.1 SMI1/KNR4 family protein [Streptomyces sp. CWNU-1]